MLMFIRFSKLDLLFVVCTVVLQTFERLTWCKIRRLPVCLSILALRNVINQECCSLDINQCAIICILKVIYKFSLKNVVHTRTHDKYLCSDKVCICSVFRQHFSLDYKDQAQKSCLLAQVFTFGKETIKSKSCKIWTKDLSKMSDYHMNK